MTLRPVLLALGVAGILGTTVWSAGQQQATADVRDRAYQSRATAVLVDVVVRDNQGRPVLDLRADDFEVAEDQVPQQIGSFTLVSRGTGLGIGVRVKKDEPTTIVTPTGTPIKDEDDTSVPPAVIALVSLQGPVPKDFASQPGPDPTMFGMPADDDGARDDLMLGSNIVTITHYEPDIERLRASSTRIVIGVGATSNGELAQRGGLALAALLGTDAIKFPGGHGGFMGDEYGQPAGEPDAFAEQLRDVLAAF